VNEKILNSFGCGILPTSDLMILLSDDSAINLGMFECRAINGNCSDDKECNSYEYPEFR
jgi:hypothetical protein